MYNLSKTLSWIKDLKAFVCLFVCLYSAQLAILACTYHVGRLDEYVVNYAGTELMSCLYFNLEILSF